MKPSFLPGTTFACLSIALLSSCAPQPAPPTLHLPRPAPVVANAPAIPFKGSIPGNAPQVKVALLVPLSGESAIIGTSLLDAATMAVYDSYFSVPAEQIHSQIVLLPKDTGNTPGEAARAAEQAIAQGATFIIGPLFSQSVTAVAPIAAAHNVSILALSNNKAVARNNIGIFGFLPEQQVDRIAEYASLHKLLRVAVLAPNDPYGEKVRDELNAIYEKKGGTIAPVELHAPSAVNIDAAVTRLANSYNNTPEDKRFQAIFIADGGAQLKNIIDSLKRSHIDLSKVQLLGTGLWDDPEIAKIAEMKGAWFPSAQPEPYQIFERHFIATYRYKPARLASLAYDAVSLTATLTMASNDAKVNTAALLNPQGFFNPANGLVRVRADGITERKLAILEIIPGGFKVISPAEKMFER